MFPTSASPASCSKSKHCMTEEEMDQFYDLANDCGIIPMRDKETGKPFRFLDWLEYWADRTAGLGSNEYFSLSETVQLPKAPDNPDIMGWKMGWIE